MQQDSSHQDVEVISDVLTSNLPQIQDAPEFGGFVDRLGCCSYTR